MHIGARRSRATDLQRILGNHLEVKKKGLIGKTDSCWSKGLTLHIHGPQGWARGGADKTSP